MGMTESFFVSLFLVQIVFVSSLSAKQQRSYTTGISDLVRNAVRRSLTHLTTHSNYYDSDVFRYTQLTERSGRTLYAGESCRLSANLCSYDEQCCSGRCICRRWTITGEERCVRKCL